mgnify:CR=1 FL=1
MCFENLENIIICLNTPSPPPFTGDVNIPQIVGHISHMLYFPKTKPIFTFVLKYTVVF